jgi:RNA polymerase sigma factor (TIGR02999 family)
MNEVTRIITAIQQGDARAADELLPLVYQELRHLAAQKMSREQPGQTLQATALVHEAYLRLVGTEDKNWDGRAHFFSAAAEAMRRILIEKARQKKRFKHGGDHKRIALDDIDFGVEAPSDDLIVLDEAIAKLTAEDPVKAELVKLRYFAGLTVEQTAKMLKISRATADRYWAYARAWLFHEMNKGGGKKTR